VEEEVYGVNNKEYTRKRSVDHVIAESTRCARSNNLEVQSTSSTTSSTCATTARGVLRALPQGSRLPFDVILMANLTTERPHRAPRRRLRLQRARVRGASDYFARGVPQEHDAQATDRRRRLDHASTASAWAR
jgi:hypothetical protein